MTTSIKQTKTKTYIKFNCQIFVTNNDWTNRTIELVDFSKINDQQAAAINSEYNWMSIGEHESVDTAYQSFIELSAKNRAQRHSENEILKSENDKRKEAEWNSIKDMEVIPATLENIRIVLQYLNGMNWGGWKLPKMSIGYSAAQYDCDGVLASTMSFNSPIEGQTKFKVGGKNGHLNKYQAL